MYNSQGKFVGNVSLPERLQSPDLKTCTAQDLDNQPYILNMQRAMYKSVIDDLELKIDRLHARNDKLEDFFDYVEKYSSSKNVESEGAIVELNTNIAFQTKKVDELKQRYGDLEKNRQARIAEHEKRVNQLKNNFEETKRRLSSEIKLLNAKINSLEDYKSAEEALTTKFNNRNEYIARKEEELEQTLKDFEFKTKVHRENLKKETYKKVLDASNDFQSDLKTTIPITVQRMLRENIIIENELVQCWSEHANMTDQKVNCEKNFREYNERIKEAKSRTRPRLITSKIQNLLIERLKKAHATIKKKLSKAFDAPDRFEDKYQKIIDSTRGSEFTSSDVIRRKLEVVLHQEKIKLELANQFKSKTFFALGACCQALGTIKYAVNTAISEEAELVDVESFASYLLNIIEDCNSRKWIAPTESLETVEFSSSVYPKGDLGFEPEHVEVEDQLIKKVDKAPSKSVMSTFEILKELEELQEKVTKEKRVSDTRSHDSVSTYVSTDSKADKSGSTTESADEKRRQEKLRLFYDEIFGDDGEFEYEGMEDNYDDYSNYGQE